MKFIVKTEHSTLKDLEELKQKGVKEGQSIVIGEMEFEFFE